jgi:peroxiredoxin
VGAELRLDIVRAGKDKQLVAALAVRPDLEVIQKNRLVGRAAPDFEIHKATGLFAPRLAALKGQVVLLDFWATWCRPCVASLPHVQELHERYAKQGLRVVGVTTEDFARVSDLVKKRGLTYAQVSDEGEQISARYFVTAIPTAVLISRDGTVAQVSIADWSAVDRTLASLLK